MNNQKFVNALRGDSIYVFTVMILFVGVFLLYTDASNRVISYTDESRDEEDAQLSIVAISTDAVSVPEAVIKPVAEVTAPPESKTPSEIAEEYIKLYQQEEQEEEVKELIEQIEKLEISTPQKETRATDVEDSAEVEESVDGPETTLITLPYLRTIFREGVDWELGYGGVSFENEQLVIGGANETASLAILPTSSSLIDYEFNTRVDWNRGSSFSLVSRFADYGNYVTCQFLQSASQVSIVSVVNGERNNEASSPGLAFKNFESWKDLELGMKVAGNSVSCTKDGKTVLSIETDSISESGGVGFGIWGKFNGDALAHVKEVRIQ